MLALIAVGPLREQCEAELLIWVSVSHSGRNCVSHRVFVTRIYNVLQAITQSSTRAHSPICRQYCCGPADVTVTAGLTADSTHAWTRCASVFCTSSVAHARVVWDIPLLHSWSGSGII